MTDTFSNLKSICERAKDLAPVMFIVPLQGSLAVAVYAEAMKANIKVETLIAESVRAYLGDCK